MKKRFRVLEIKIFICLSVLIISGCKEGVPDPPEFNIASVEVSPDYIAVENKTLFTIFTNVNSTSPHQYRWELEQPDGSTKDTVTEENRLYWIAPLEPGELFHKVWVESQSGEVLSEPYSFTVTVDPGHPKNGNTLVFSRKIDGVGYYIFTLDEDGSNLKQLTFEREGISPTWSPDGNQILFSSFDQGTSHAPAIFVMEADGSNQRLLYDPDPDNFSELPILGSAPRWSPDGTKITFELYWGYPWTDGYSIGVFDILTKELTRVTKHWETLGHPAYDYNPFWSFDGQQIVFTSDRDYITGDSLRYRTDLYIINADGTELERITENGKAMNPIWSNAGNQNIIFVRFRHLFDGSESGVYSVNIQTGELVLIQKDPSENIFLFPYALSPDGTQLVTLAEQRYSPWNSTIYLIDFEQNSMMEVFSENSNNANAKTYGLDWYFYEE